MTGKIELYMAMSLLESVKPGEYYPVNTSPSHHDSGLFGADPFADHDKESASQLKTLPRCRLLASYLWGVENHAAQVQLGSECKTSNSEALIKQAELDSIIGV